MGRRTVAAGVSRITSRLYVPPCGAETVTRYRLPEPARPVTDPPAPSWPIVSVQPLRVPAFPDALSLTRKVVLLKI